MYKLKKLKLNQLSKRVLEASEMSPLKGGTFCKYGYDNQSANETEGKCSCLCSYADYYGSDGLRVQAGRMLKFIQDRPFD